MLKRHGAITAGVILYILLVTGQGVAGFVNNGNGTVTDTDTGLTWLVQTLGPMNLTQAYDTCEDGTWGGYDDWRLPDRNELQSIVDYHAYNPAIDGEAFPGTQSSGYWDGVVSYAEATSTYQVRPVRGGQRAPITQSQCQALTPYVDNGDGTIYDEETGLTWLQVDLGAMTLTQAFDACETGTWAGFDDWRLPDRNELQSLVVYKRYNPAVDPQMFPSTDADPSQGWYVRFSDGVVSYAEATSTYQVRPVRGGQKQRLTPSQCQALTPYFDAGDAAVADANTGLMWLKTTLGPMTWAQALATCETGTWGGHDDWRLPDRNELQSLVLYKRYNPAIDPQKFFDTYASAYWTATTNTPLPSKAWYVRFSDGAVSSADKSGSYYIRPVRDNSGSIVVDYKGDRGWALEGEDFTLRFLSEERIQAYFWDFDNDGLYYHTSFDNRVTHFFTEPGTYIVRARALTTDGDEIFALVIVQVGEPRIIDVDIRFEPFAPSDDTIASTVMKGGKAVRYYQVLSTGTGLAQTGRRICYTLEAHGPVYCKDTDDKGFLEVVTPAMEYSRHFDLNLVNPDGSIIGLAVTDPPSFSVSVEERTFKESYGLFMGKNVSVDAGLGAKVGPVEFNALKAGIGKEDHVMTDFEYENCGADTDFSIGNTLGAELTSKLKAGLFGKTAINTPTRPKLEIGVQAKLRHGQEYSTGYEFKGFLDNRDVDEAQALAAGIILLESVMNANRQTVVGLDRLLMGLIRKAGERHGLDMVADSTGFSFSVGGEASLKASLAVSNPLGLSGNGIPGSGLEFDINGFDGKFVHTYDSEFSDDGTAKYELSIVGSLDIGSFSLSLGQKFCGDKRKKNTPKFTLDSIVSTPAWIQMDGEYGAGITQLPDGSTQMEYYRLLERDDSNYLIFGTDTRETYMYYTISDPLVIQWLAEESDLAWKMEGMLYGDQSLDISPQQFSGFMTNLINNEIGTVDWEEKTRDQQMFDLDFEFELGAGLYLGVGGKFKAWKKVEFVSAEGKLENGSQYISAFYEKDKHIANNIRGVDPFLQAGRRAVRDACDTLIKTVRRVVEMGQEAVVVITETGAKIKSAAGNLYPKSKLFLSKINPLRASYAIKALSRASSKGPETANAYTIGDVYIVNVHDENGEPLTEFPAPLELSLPYTESDLTSAGFTLADAGRLRIYRWDGDTGYYILIGGTVNETEQLVTAMIDRPGQYLLAIDGAAPEFGQFNVTVGTRTPEISFLLLDSLSGIDASTIEMRIDGDVMVSGTGWENVYNMTSGQFTFQVTDALDIGAHSLDITASDRMGNVLTHTQMFEINDLAPVITHTPVGEAMIDEPLVIKATVTDDQDVAGVILAYRAQTDEMAYVLATMTLNEISGQYEAMIPAPCLTGHGIRYYIRAIDISENIAETDAFDIVITDLEGPQIPGDLTIAFSDGRFRVSWPLAADKDTAGYHLYRGSSLDDMVNMGDLGLTGSEFLDVSWDDHYVGIQAVDDFNNFGPMAGPVLVGRKADLDRDRDVDGKDIHGVILKLESGDTNLTLEEAAKVLGDIF